MQGRRQQGTLQLQRAQKLFKKKKTITKNIYFVKQRTITKFSMKEAASESLYLLVKEA